MVCKKAVKINYEINERKKKTILIWANRFICVFLGVLLIFWTALELWNSKPHGKFCSNDSIQPVVVQFIVWISNQLDSNAQMFSITPAGWRHSPRNANVCTSSFNTCCLCHVCEAYWWLFELTLSTGWRRNNEIKENKRSMNSRCWMTISLWFTTHRNQKLLHCVRHLSDSK